MEKLLVTAEPDEAHLLIDGLSGTGVSLVHLPLEKVGYSTEPEQRESILAQLDEYRFVVYGGLRNARYFVQWMEQSEMTSEIQQKVHLAMNQAEADFLEQAGIAAIVPREGGRPIDIMEFLLRISIGGAVLYPCPEESSEEMPALLQELGMQVAEFTVCRSVPIGKKDVEEKRMQIRDQPPDGILFHSRGSVIRTKTAFPGVDLQLSTLIAASEGVAGKLQQEGLSADMTASGTWRSVLELLKASAGN
ncbi:MAG: uroporphyrinogen-III synthase [Balneolaceae bacterium]